MYDPTPTPMPSPEPTPAPAQTSVPAPGPQVASSAPDSQGGPSAPVPTPGVPAAPSVPRRRLGCAVPVAGLIGGVIGAVSVAGVLYLFPPRPAPPDTPPASTAGAVRIVTDAKAESIEAVAAKVTPSVVNVSVAQQAVNRRTGAYVTQVVGNASGVIIRSDGYILTNNHVVEGADAILVRLGVDDVTAKVVGTDPSTDLAMLKVDRKGLQAAEIGSSAGLKVGATVVAVGSPFGLDKTVTSGIVSALNRSNLSETGDVAAYTNLIQTDAAINPGNSGGALVDLNGLLVGINTLIESPSGSVGAPQSAGIGFAIPIDFAMRVAEQLIATGKAEHPFMGVSMATVDESFAIQIDVPDARGAYIDSVVGGSPAEKAGLRQGDIITSIGGDVVRSVEDAFAAIRSRGVGESVDVVVLRDGKPVTVKVTLGSDVTGR